VVVVTVLKVPLKYPLWKPVSTVSRVIDLTHRLSS
jgi:hypothetical protein